MPISLVNKTTYSNPSNLTSGSFNLVSSSTIGNVLVVAISVKFTGSAVPVTLQTDQGETFTKADGAIDSLNTGSPGSFVYYLLTTKVSNSISFAATAGSPSSIPTMIVYELSGGTFTFVGHGSQGFKNVSSYTQTLTGTPIASNAVVLYVSISRAAITGVAPAATETDALPIPNGAVDIVSAYLYNNVSSDPAPVFTLGSAAIIAVPAAAFLGGTPPPPQPPPPPISLANQEPQGNPSADVIWWHTGFTGIDSEIAAIEGMISEGGPPNIPWLLGLAASQGNAMTEALARSNILYSEPSYGDDGGGGGNESGASELGGGSTNGLLVSW